MTRTPPPLTPLYCKEKNTRIDELEKALSELRVEHARVSEANDNMVQARADYKVQALSPGHEPNENLPKASLIEHGTNTGPDRAVEKAQAEVCLLSTRLPHWQTPIYLRSEARTRLGT